MFYSEAQRNDDHAIYLFDRGAGKTCICSRQRGKSLPGFSTSRNELRAEAPRDAGGLVPLNRASSIELVESYVANGLGIGLTMMIPKRPFPPTVRVLPLAGFPPVVVGAMWRGRLTPLFQAFLAELRQRAADLDGSVLARVHQTAFRGLRGNKRAKDVVNESRGD